MTAPPDTAGTRSSAAVPSWERQRCRRGHVNVVDRVRCRTCGIALPIVVEIEVVKEPEHHRRRYEALIAPIVALLLVVVVTVWWVLSQSSPLPPPVRSGPSASLGVSSSTVAVGQEVTLQARASRSQCELVVPPGFDTGGGSTVVALGQARSIMTSVRVLYTTAPGAYQMELRCADVTVASTRLQVTRPSVPAKAVSTAKTSSLQILATGCGAGTYGTGVLVAPRLVATAAAVVQGARSLAVSRGADTYTGVVATADPVSGIALIRISADARQISPPASAKTPLTPSAPAVIAGYPAGDTVRALQAVVTATSGSRVGLNVGSAAPAAEDVQGSPVFDSSGRMAGLVVGVGATSSDQLAVAPLAELMALVSAPTARRPPAPRCTSPVGPSNGADIVAVTTSAAPPAGVVDVLSRYFRGVNAHDWDAVASTMTKSFAASLESSTPTRIGDRSTYNFAITLTRVRGTSPVLARVTFTSLQDSGLGPNGNDTCDQWQVTYQLLPNRSGSWLIDGVTLRSVTPCS